MNIKKINSLPEDYLTPLSGTNEWYACKHCKTSFCDLYEAEEIYNTIGEFTGAVSYLIHYPDGEVFYPFELKKNVYIEEPIFTKDGIGFLEVNFSSKQINIYNFTLEEHKLIKLVTLELQSVKNCYNLKLGSIPLHLGRCENDGYYEMIWPMKKTIAIGEHETFMFQIDDRLYFNNWYEDPEYHNEVVVRDYDTGEELERFFGDIFPMPDGTYWRL